MVCALSKDARHRRIRAMKSCELFPENGSGRAAEGTMLRFTFKYIQISEAIEIIEIGERIHTIGRLAILSFASVHGSCVDGIRHL